MLCSFAPLAGAAAHPNPVARFDPEEPDGDYDLNLSVPAQRQVGEASTFSKQKKQSIYPTAPRACQFCPLSQPLIGHFLSPVGGTGVASFGLLPGLEQLDLPKT